MIIEENNVLQTLGVAIEGEQQAAQVLATETPVIAAEESISESTEQKVDGTETPTEEEQAAHEVHEHETEVDHAETARAIDGFSEGLTANAVETSSRKLFSFKTSWAAMYRPAFLKGNRDIDRKHVDALMALLKGKGKSRFSVCGTAVPLQTLLNQMAELPEEKRLHFYDIEGNEVTLDTPGVREGLYYLVLDGQHRVGACHVYGLDMDFQLVEIEGDSIIDFIADFNTGAKNWQGEDWISAHRATGKYTSPLFGKMDEIGEILPSVSERYKVYILTGDRDGIKKSDAIQGKEPVGYYEALAIRGIGFAKAIAKRLPRTGKDLSKQQKLVAKYFTSLSGIDLIQYVPGKIAGDMMAGYDIDMKNFLGTLTDKQVKDMADKIEAKNIGELQKYFLSEYRRFAGAHTKDRDTLSSEIDAGYDEIEEKRNKKAAEDRERALPSDSSHLKERPSKLKNGSIDEMKRNAEAIQKYLENKNKQDKAKKGSH